MTAANHDFIIEKGATFKTSMQWIDSEDASVDLTGYEIRMQARKSKRSDSVVIDVSTATSGITITSATGGQFDVELSATQTAALPQGSLYYDLELEDSSGFVTRLLEGKITLSEEVTR